MLVVGYSIIYWAGKLEERTQLHTRYDPRGAKVHWVSYRGAGVRTFNKIHREPRWAPSLKIVHLRANDLGRMKSM